MRVLRPNVLRPHSHLFSLHQLRQEGGHIWDRMEEAKATALFVPTVGGRSLSPLFITQPSASVSVLVSSSTQPRRPHRSPEARTNLGFGGLLKMKISHQQRRLKRRMTSSRRRKKSRIKSRYPISLASINEAADCRCVLSAYAREAGFNKQKRCLMEEQSQARRGHKCTASSASSVTVESTTRLRRHQPLRASM